jgi:hypothetical protein
MDSCGRGGLHPRGKKLFVGGKILFAIFLKHGGIYNVKYKGVFILDGDAVAGSARSLGGCDV